MDDAKDDVLGSIGEAFGAGRTAVPGSSRQPLKAPTGSPSADPSNAQVSATLRQKHPASESSDALEDQARAAMLAAAAAILEPWLYMNLPRVVEQRLNALLNVRLDQALNAAVDQQLGPEIRKQIAVLGEKLETVLNERVAVSLREKLEPAVIQQIAAVEERIERGLNAAVA
ncbi:MAG TPA: hypothetical protein VIF14_13965, partial [Alphaproteobacteria bacterium]